MISKNCLLTLVFLSTVFTGCGSGGGGETDAELVRVFHAAPNNAVLSVVIDDKVSTDNSSTDTSSSSSEGSASRETANAKAAIDIPTLTYGQGTEYFPVLEGNRRFQVKSESAILSLIDERLTVSSGKTYTYILYEDSHQLTTSLKEDDNSRPEEGQFRLRIAHFSPWAEAVDVYIYHLGDDMSDVDPVATNLSLKGFTDYFEVDEGTYRVKFTPTNSSRVLLDAGQLHLRQGEVATLFLLDQEQGGRPLTSALMIDATY